MKYRTNNKHSVQFSMKKTAGYILAPFTSLYQFMQSVNKDIRTSEREDFDFFMVRTLDPERTQSIFA